MALTLTGRTTAILAGALAVSLSVSLASAAFLMEQSNNDADHRIAVIDAGTVEQAIQGDLDALAWTTREMASVSTVLFAGTDQAPQGGGAAQGMSLVEQVGASLTSTNGVESVYFVWPDGTVMGWRLDDETGRFVNESLLHRAEVAAIDWSGLGAFQLGKQILVGQEGPVMLGAYRLSFGNDASAPVLVAARPMGTAYIEAMEGHLDREIRLAAAPVNREPGLQVAQVDARQAASFTMAGAPGTPDLLVTVHGERTAFIQGEAAIRLLVTLGLVTTITAVAVAAFWVRATVTGRVRRLAETVQTVRHQDDLTTRINMRGTDEVAGLAGAFDDLLAELETGRRRLKERNAALGRFAAVASHDLRSPLSTLRLNLDIMARTLPDDVRQQERVARMARSIDRMDQRIGELLSDSGENRPGGEAWRQQVDLDELVQGVLQDIQGRLHGAKGRVRVAHLPTIQGHPGHLERLFQNLLDNAIKYARPGISPRIQIWAIRRNQTWSLAIDDNGRGFAQDDAAGLFIEGHRLDDSEDQEGRGIGLAACKRIAERHGGSIRAFGKPGAGARFVVSLPVSCEESEPPAVACSTTAAAAVEPPPARARRWGGRARRRARRRPSRIAKDVAAAALADPRRPQP